MDMHQRVIFLYSCKGGVGKSTVCVNLAYTFGEMGIRTGVFDADLYGPSIPFMVGGLEQQRPSISEFAISPGIYGNVAVNSVGFFMGDREGMIWEDKYVEGALEQLLYSPKWGTEMLLIDMPPGSGAIHKSLFSRMKGKALIVTTPHELCYGIASKGVDIMDRMQIDTLGVVENMAYYRCENCGHDKNVSETGRELLKSLRAPLVARLPVDPELTMANSGIPYIISSPNSEFSGAFREIADHILSNYDKNMSMRPRI